MSMGASTNASHGQGISNGEREEGNLQGRYNTAGCGREEQKCKV
jgi:hypothetical protein